MYMIWCFWLFEGECLNFNHWWPNKFSYCIYSLIFTPWQYTLLVLYLYVYFLSHRFKHFHSCQTVITKKRTELSIWISVSDRYLAGQHNMYNCTLSLSLSLSLCITPSPSLSLSAQCLNWYWAATLNETRPLDLWMSWSIGTFKAWKQMLLQLDDTKSACSGVNCTTVYKF